MVERYAYRSIHFKGIEVKTLKTFLVHKEIIEQTLRHQNSWVEGVRICTIFICSLAFSSFSVYIIYVHHCVFLESSTILFCENMISRLKYLCFCSVLLGCAHQEGHEWHNTFVKRKFNVDKDSTITWSLLSCRLSFKHNQSNREAIKSNK